jgi:hypothetical protein
MYKWRHDRVLELLNKWLCRALKIENKDSEEGGLDDDDEEPSQQGLTHRGIARGRLSQLGNDEHIARAKIFVAAKESNSEQGSDKWPCPGRPLDAAQDLAYAMASRGRSASFLDPAGEWQIAIDLKHLVFPTEILVTAQRPDIVVWSRLLKHIILIELTVPWEENIEASHKRKLDRYNELVAQCRKKGWRCELFAVEVGVRGFVSPSVLSLLRRFGIQNRYRRKALREISLAAEAGSAWIWDKFSLADISRSNC